MNKLHFFILFAAGLTLAHQAEAQQPELLQAALQTPEALSQYRHTVFIKDDEFEGTARIDPTKPAGQRILLVDSTLDADDPDLLALLADADEQPMDGFWCHEMAELVPDTVDEIDRTENSVTYRFTPLPGADSDEDDVAFMKNLTGEVEVDQAARAVTSLRLYAPRAFRLSLAVKVKQFEMNAVCEPLEMGGSRLVETTTRVEARALFKRLKQLEVKRITDVERID